MKNKVKVQKNRYEFIDIAKGFLIISVVIGHSGFKYAYMLYWFHIPTFLLVSGILFKPTGSFVGFKETFIKRFKSLIIPYLFYTIICSLIYLYDNKELVNSTVLFKFVERLLKGGQSLQGYFGVFWFISSLFFTQVAFSLLTVTKIKKRFLALILAIIYIIGHIQIWIMNNKGVDMPTRFAFNTIFITSFYFGIGYLVRGNSEKLKSKSIQIIASVTSLIILIVFTLLSVLGSLDYKLDIKNLVYNNILLDLLIPLAFSVIILVLSKKMEKFAAKRFFMEVGKLSIIIMFLHVPINLFLKNYIDINWIVYTIIGVFVPYILGEMILRLNKKPLNLLFLGKIN